MTEGPTGSTARAILAQLRHALYLVEDHETLEVSKCHFGGGERPAGSSPFKVKYCDLPEAAGNQVRQGSLAGDLSAGSRSVAGSNEEALASVASGLYLVVGAGFGPATFGL